MPYRFYAVTAAMIVSQLVAGRSRVNKRRLAHSQYYKYKLLFVNKWC